MLRRNVARRGAGFAEFSLGKIADNVRERKVAHVHAHSVHSVASAQTVALGQAVGRLDLPCNEHLTIERKMVIAGRIGTPQAADCLAGKFSADGAVRRTAAGRLSRTHEAHMPVSYLETTRNVLGRRKRSAYIFSNILDAKCVPE